MMCVRRVVQRLRDNGTAGEELQKQLREQAEGLKQSPVTQVDEGERSHGGGLFGSAGESVEFRGSAGSAEIRGLDEGIRVCLINGWRKCFFMVAVCLNFTVREHTESQGRLLEKWMIEGN